MSPRPSDPARDRTLALALATLAMAANFWAWALLSPLAPSYRTLLDLSPFALSLMVAVPVIVGSLGRIAVGALTDRFGGRVMFAVVSFVGIVPVLLLSVATSYPAVLVGGLLLGITGASFAVGVPFVNAWFPPERRGFALGVFGMGNIGTAVSGFLSPPLYDVGSAVPFLTVAAVLAVTGVAFLLLGRDAPGRTPSTVPFVTQFRGAVGLRVTRELAALYAITFGGFVAFSVYLPTYLREAHDLSVGDAAARAAGFVVLATLARPVGGMLADRYSGRPVLLGSLAVVAGMAVVAAFEPGLPVAPFVFLTIAAALGCGNGAVFAILGRTVEPQRVGAVTGVVGAAGGLGGFLPPIVMGLVLQATGSYAIGFMLLSDVALAGLVFTAVAIRPTRVVPTTPASADPPEATALAAARP